MIVDRNARERDRLRIKRQDAEYLAAQRANRAAQMRDARRRRRSLGLCHHCEKKRWGGTSCCRFHLIYERNRRSK